MTDAGPEVSVLIPVYNGERFLAAAIESIQGQTLRDLEIVVVDDGSTDATAQILARYASEDPRLVVRRQENSGHGAAANAGLALCRAPFVARLDADDIALPGRIEAQARFLRAHPAVAVVGGGLSFIDEDGRDFAETLYPATDTEVRAWFGQMRAGIAQPAAMMRKAAVDGVHGYRLQFGVSEDIDLWLRLLERHQLANLPEVVTRYRIHGAQATVLKLEHQSLCCVAAHLAARERAAGRPDPFEGLGAIDSRAVLQAGGTMEEITAYFVQVATWMAKTAGRAGRQAGSDALFGAALDKARSPWGSAELVAAVRRARVQRYREQGRWLRARLASWRSAGGAGW